MSELEMIEKIKLMPPDYQDEVKKFVDYIWEKKMGKNPDISGRNRAFGLLKGKIWMSPDFDEPLDDFKDYM